MPWAPARGLAASGLRRLWRPVSALGLGGLSLGLRRPAQAEEPDVTQLLRRAAPLSWQEELETGRSVLEQVQQVLQAHFGHLRLGALDPAAVFFSVLAKRELRTPQWKQDQVNSSRLAVHDLKGDVLFFEELLRYARLADAAYLPDEASVSGALEPGFELLAGSCAARPQRPAHFLAKSAEAGKVVLVVRGTQTLADCLTDCLCDGQSLGSGGLAHRGAAVAAEWLVREYGEALRFLEEGLPTFLRRFSSALSADRFGESGGRRAAGAAGVASGGAGAALRRGYEVVLVGHSLGAAVAASCAVQLRSHGGGLSVRCVCFAPPATVDPSTALDCKGYVTSVVHDDDVIPRMQIRSLLQLYHDVGSYNWLPRALEMVRNLRQDPQGWVLEYGDYAFGLPLEERLESLWRAQLEKSKELKEVEAEYGHIQPLRIPGFVVHLYRSPSECGYGATQEEAAALEHIELSPTMVTDHMLDAYIEALARLLAEAEDLHKEDLQTLRRILPELSEEAQQTAAFYTKSARELVAKARSKLQQRPDTS
ncbi:unnamed protein product [Effrenium voratum]|nr:unnamed protein product [Effrenium voratum]